MIIFDNHTQTFHLQNKKISYLLGIEENNYLTHLYFGKRLRTILVGIATPEQIVPSHPTMQMRKIVYYL